MTITCSTCNGELLTSNGQTFCPACLLQQGMKNSTYGAGPKIAWQPPAIEKLSAAFPHLEIQQLLGQGGMGAVYKVRQKELDRIAALKVLPGEIARSIAHHAESDGHSSADGHTSLHGPGTDRRPARN